MAPLPIESTDRIVVDHTWRGRPSTVLYRFVSPTTLAAMVTALNTFYGNVLGSFYTNWAMPGTANYYAQGQLFSTPVVGLTPRVGSLGADPLTHPAAYQVQATGRSAGGRRVSYYYQGFKWLLDADQRKAGSEDADVQALLTALTTLRTAGLVSINGLPPGFKPYVNLVFNDYLTQQARGG